MTLPLDLQFYAFFVMVLAGAGLGALYDLYRAARSVFRPRGWALVGADLLFWAAAATLAAAALYFGNWGELRLYVLIGAATGLGLYHGLASVVVFRLARAAIAAGVAFLRRIGAALRRLLDRTWNGLIEPGRRAMWVAQEAAKPRIAAAEARIVEVKAHMAGAKERIGGRARASARRLCGFAKRWAKWLLTPPGRSPSKSGGGNITGSRRR